MRVKINDTARQPLLVHFELHLHKSMLLNWNTVYLETEGNNIVWKISSLSNQPSFDSLQYVPSNALQREVAAHTESLFYEAYLMERSLRSIEFPDLFAATASKDTELHNVANQISDPRRENPLYLTKWRTNESFDRFSLVTKM